MALSETKRMEYERLYLENKPSLNENEVRSPNKTVLSVGAGQIPGTERLVLKLATNKGTETLSLNPMIAYYLMLLLMKGIQKNDWIEIEYQVEGQITRQ